MSVSWLSAIRGEQQANWSISELNISGGGGHFLQFVEVHKGSTFTLVPYVVLQRRIVQGWKGLSGEGFQTCLLKYANMQIDVFAALKLVFAGVMPTLCGGGVTLH